MNFRRLHPLSALGPLRAWAALWMAASVSIFAAEHPPSASAPAGITSLDEEEQSLLKLGSRLGERGDFDAAEIAFRQVLGSPRTQATDEKTALLGLAQLHRRQGALTKAAAIYERLLKEYPDADETPEAMLTLGRTLRALGAHKLAIARFYSVLNSTLKLGGASLDRYQLLAKTAQFEIAETHFQAGNFAEASKFFSRLRLLDLAPVDRARAHFKAGYSLRLQGDLEGAVGDVQLGHGAEFRRLGRPAGLINTAVTIASTTISEPRIIVCEIAQEAPRSSANLLTITSSSSSRADLQYLICISATAYTPSPRSKAVF